MARFNVLLSGYSVVDETLNRSGSTAAPIGHDYIIGTSYEIWTGAGKTGTKLVLNTDYTLNNKNDYYSASSQANTDIYTKVSIINGTYQNTTLYQTYTTIGDMLSLENIREVVIGNTAVVTGNYTIPESVGRVLVNTANAVTLTISADHPLYKRIEIQRLVASTNAVTVARSGSETINGATSFITHGEEASSKLNKNIIELIKTGSTEWTWTSGIVSGSTTGKSWKKDHTGYSIYRYVTTLASGAGQVTTVTHGLNNTRITGVVGGSFYYGSSGNRFPLNYIAEDGTRGAHVSVIITNTGIVIYNDVGLGGGYFSSPVSVELGYYE